MSLKEKLLEDSSDIFLNNSEFAEEITYISSTSKAILIDAVVVRLGLEPGAENVSRSLRNQAEIYVANDGVSGIIKLDKKDDRIVLNDSEGIRRNARINEVLNRDQGMWHLLIGW